MFLLYNRVNQLQVLTDIYPLPLVLPPPPHPTHLGHHRASGCAARAGGDCTSHSQGAFPQLPRFSLLRLEVGGTQGEVSTSFS